MSNIRVVFKQAHSPRGVRRDFKQTYDEILELIGEHEFEEAARLLTEMRYSAKAFLFEDAMFWLLNYWYLDLAGNADPRELRDSLRRAVGYQEDYLEPDAMVFAAQRLYALQVQDRDFSAAINTYRRLRASEAARRSSAYPEVLGEMEHHLERVLAVINGEDVLVINARIGEHGYWVHDLMRRSFSLEEIAGRLELVDIRCSHGTRRDAAISEGRIWKVPRDWGQCGVYIKGSEGASFNLYEHADTEGVRYTIQPKREMQYACVQVAFRKFRTVCQDHPNSKNVLR